MITFAPSRRCRNDHNPRAAEPPNHGAVLLNKRLIVLLVGSRARHLDLLCAAPRHDHVVHECAERRPTIPLTTLADEYRNPTLCRIGNVTAELHGRNRKVTLAGQYFSDPSECAGCVTPSRLRSGHLQDVGLQRSSEVPISDFCHPSSRCSRAGMVPRRFVSSSH